MMERLAALASIAVRHADAYAELILSDIDATRRGFHRRIIVGTVMVAATVLAAGMACVWVIALTWDTPARIGVIVALLGLFVAVAGSALWKLNALTAGEPRMLSQTAREWAKDRQLLEELLAHERAEPS